MSNIKKPKYQKELERFNFAFITMENRAMELYEAKYGEKSMQGADDLILERFAGYREIDDIERFQKILRKLKKEVKELL